MTDEDPARSPAPGHEPDSGRGSRNAEGGHHSADGDEPAVALVCELCGGPVLDRHCKILCLNCGYQRDCSDP